MILVLSDIRWRPWKLQFFAKSESTHSLLNAYTIIKLDSQFANVLVVNVLIQS
jgi:hypothetical protein